jgi:hypothetical protein
MLQCRERHHHSTAHLTFNALLPGKCLHLSPVTALETCRATDACAGIHQQSDTQFLSAALH